MLLAGIALVMAVVLARASWRVGLGIAAWLAFTGALAASGWLASFDAMPPRLLRLVVPALVAAVVVARRMTLPSVAWPIAIQTLRLPIELALHRLHVEGVMPQQMTFEGRNFDIVIGLTAPLVAWAVANGKVGAKVVLVWNLLGLGLLANVVSIAVTSFPGPLHRDWPGAPLTIVTMFPYVWLPTLLVPIALFGHVASLRALVAPHLRGPRALAGANR